MLDSVLPLTEYIFNQPHKEHSPMLQKDAAQFTPTAALSSGKFSIKAAMQDTHKYQDQGSNATEMIYVGRLDKDATVDRIHHHLYKIGIKNEDVADVLTLNCRKTDERSFCLFLHNEKAKNTVMDTNKWPDGIRIRPFKRATPNMKQLIDQGDIWHLGTLIKFCPYIGCMHGFRNNRGIYGVEDRHRSNRKYLCNRKTTCLANITNGVEMRMLEVPLHEVIVKSSLINDNIVIGMRPSLRVEGISLILGNDLADQKVMVDPRVVEKPRDDEKTERLAEKFPGIFPASIVTRSMKAKKEAIKEQGKEEFGLSCTFLENIDGKFEERNKEKAEEALMRNESRNVKGDIPGKQEGESKSVISRQNLIEEQNNDTELLDLFKIALTPVEAEKVSVAYLIKDNILIRKWSPTECDNSEKGTVYQIVVPKVHRREVLELAHDLPKSDHLGERKTYDTTFFWLGLKRDVSKWCKECHTCQLGGKPNQNIPQASLHPIPAFDEPFSHMIIDCVGPLPKTKSQNEYLLTMMCSSIRFPEAIPLRSIKTNAILKALIKFFILFGLPKSIQSDQGNNFMAHAFQQVMIQLGIKQYKSSAYHPESQEALERFHQTLKTMIKMYCIENIIEREMA